MKSILWITLTNIGDVVLSLPTLSVLKGNFPEARIVALVGPRGLDILTGIDSVDEVIVYDKKAPWLDKWRLIKELRKYRFGLVFDLKHSLIPLFLSPKIRTSYIRRRSKQKIGKRQEHLNLLKSLKPATKIDFHLRRRLSLYRHNDQLRVEKILEERGVKDGRYLAFAPGAQSRIKRWLPAHFAALADRLIGEFKIPIVLVGADSERKIIEEVRKYSRNPLIDLCGQTNLRELAVVLDQALFVVSNDSAPLQIAYSLDRPVVALFGPTDPEIYGLKSAHHLIQTQTLACEPCMLAECHNTKSLECLVELDPEKVFEACLSLISFSESEDRHDR